MDITVHLMVWPLIAFMLGSAAVLFSRDPAEDMACILADCLELVYGPDWARDHTGAKDSPGDAPERVARSAR